MMPKFEHFVITRFNIPAEGWDVDKNKQPVNNDSWLTSRIELFEQFCFPSLKNQTNKNFKWLVFFDPNSPQFLKDKITEWCAACSIFFPLYAVNYDQFIEYELGEKVQTIASSESKYILTTRIDNDDAFHENAIDTIQRQFIPGKEYIIELRTGISLDILNNIALKRNYKSNPFITLVEENNKQLLLKTVMAEGHPKWIEIVSFKVVQGKPMWIQVIHDKNVSNALKGYFSFSAFRTESFHISFIKDNLLRNTIRFKLIHYTNNVKHGIKYLIVQFWKMLPLNIRNKAHFIKNILREIPYKSKIDKNKVKYLIKKHLRKTDITLVDIGANKGDFYKEAKNYLKIKKAFLIEPLPYLEKELNLKYGGKNCEIISELLSNHVGEKIKFNINEFDETSSILNIDNKSEHLARIPTKTINQLELISNTLDNICKTKEIFHIDLLKIDVQGAEIFVLEGGQNMLNHTDYIWIETSFQSLYENSALFSDIYSILKKRDFAMIELSPGFRNSKQEIIQADILFKKIN
jgi:FkbM family methyltransferase